MLEHIPRQFFGVGMIVLKNVSGMSGKLRSQFKHAIFISFARPFYADPIIAIAASPSANLSPGF